MGLMANLTAVLAQLRQRRDEIGSRLTRLDHALAVLSTLDGRGKHRTGIRRMTAAGRAHIVAAQKARWAKWRRRRKAA